MVEPELEIRLIMKNMQISYLVKHGLVNFDNLSVGLIAHYSDIFESNRKKSSTSNEPIISPNAPDKAKEAFLFILKRRTSQEVVDVVSVSYDTSTAKQLCSEESRKQVREKEKTVDTKRLLFVTY
ncbi:hypothetical protein LOAG_01278 [Loa loa]|uniref:Uncharacterized protein n=1 Tax=Loa loa TaxID=7209 RepID=A0A1S0U9C8_LOALO|nr:hypothetical protein LOAG_01278 [Loa loa]EFO27213.1 hypothetical protein LOAG_01278 [Loa loa]